MKKQKLLTKALAAILMACTLTSCSEKKPTSISLSPNSVTITEGETATLSVTVNPSDCKYGSITWSTSDATVADINANGVVTGKSAGKATITAQTEGLSASSFVTVKAKVINVSSVTLDKTSLELTEGDEAALTATVAPDNATNKSLKWGSSNSGVATVDDNGKVKAVKAGTATISVTSNDGGYSAECKVTVNAKYVPVESVAIAAADNVVADHFSVIESKTLKLHAVLTPEDTSENEVNWTVEDSSIVSVSTSGVVKGLAVGETKVTVCVVQNPSISATCTITVEKNDSQSGIGNGDEIVVKSSKR